MDCFPAQGTFPPQSRSTDAWPSNTRTTQERG
jgi:hypothetical protein